MWRWLAENPKKSKGDYLKSMRVDINCLINGCFLCTYAKEGEFSECDCCPLDWGDRDCNAENSLYDEWVFYHDMLDEDGISRVARQIAELPERTEE